MDKLASDKKFKYIICPIGFVFSIVWLGIAPRTVGLIILAFLIVAYITISLHRSSKLIVKGWFVFMAVTIQPFDITFRDVPGSPKLVPYIMGLPSEEAKLKESQGEIVLGGCIVSGFEPKWVLVW